MGEDTGMDTTEGVAVIMTDVTYKPFALCIIYLSCMTFFPKAHVKA